MAIKKLLPALFDVGDATEGQVFRVGSSGRLTKTGSGMVFKDNGRMGLGTTAPGRPLDVNGTGNASVIRVGDGDTDGAAAIAYIEFGANGSSWNRHSYVGSAGADSHLWIVNEENADIKFYANNAEKMVIKNDGNVGIGTTAPAVELDVAGVIQGQKFQFNDDTNTSIDTFAADQIGFKLGANNSVKWAFVAGAYGMQFMYGSGTASYPSYTWNGDSDTGIFNATTNALGFTTGGTERVRIDSSGTIATQTNGKIATVSSAGSLTLQGGASGPGGTIRLGGGNGPSGTGDIKFSSGWASGGSGYGERMRIQEDGNVGIGTTAPAKLLHVNGDIQAKSIKLLPDSDGYTTYYSTNAAGSTTFSVLGTGQTYMAGNVGIGTTSPNANLEIKADDALLRLYSTGGGYTASLEFVRNSATFGADTHTDYRLIDQGGILKTQAGYGGSSYDVMAIDGQNSRVGIGTIGPVSQLQVGDGTDNHTWVGVRASAGYYSGIKLYRGAGTWSSNSNNNFGIIVTDAGMALGKYTDPGSNHTGRVDYLTVDALGNVGIGTTAPATALDVVGEITGLSSGYNTLTRQTANTTGATSVLALMHNTTGTPAAGFGSRFFLGSETTTTESVTQVMFDALWTTATHATRTSDLVIQLANSGTLSEKFRITGGGNVGIGTTAPIGTLNVRGADQTKQLVISNSTYESGPSLYANETGIWFKGNYSTDDERAKAAIILKGTADYGVGDLVFAIDGGASNDNAVLADEKMRIKSDGKVGIGTTAPTGKLQVKSGQAVFDDTTDAGAPSITFEGDLDTGFLREGANIIGISTGGVRRWSIGNGSMTSQITGGARIVQTAGTAAVPAFSFNDDGDTGMYRGGTNILSFTTEGVQRVVIDNGGRMSIGAATPAATLHIKESTSLNEMLYLEAKHDDPYADIVASDSGGSIRLRQYAGQFQVHTGGNANTKATGVALALTIAGDQSATFAGDAIVTGNLTVNGTTTTIDTTNLLIEDPLMLLARVQSGTPTLDSGFIIERGSSTNVGIIWDESSDNFSLINTTDTATTAGNVTIASYANLKANYGTFTGRVTASDFEMLDLGGTGRTLAVRDGASNTVKIGDGGTFSTFRFNATQVAPQGNNNCILGASSLRWSTIYGVLGNFSGALTGTSATFSGALALGGNLTIDKTIADSAVIDYLFEIAGKRTTNAVAGQGVGLRFKIPSWKDSLQTYIGAGIGAIRESATDSDVSTALTFSTSQNDATLDEAMRITSDLNVGIGTTSPTFAAVSGNTAKGLHIQNSGNDTQASLRLTGHNNTGGSPGQATYTELLHAGGNLRFDINHNGTTAISIDPQGDVGIGTTAPGAYKLSVAGAGKYSSYLDALRATFSGANGTSYALHLKNTTAATPYALWVEEPASATAGYPLLNVTSNSGTQEYLRINSGGLVRVKHPGTAGAAFFELYNGNGILATFYQNNYITMGGSSGNSLVCETNGNTTLTGALNLTRASGDGQIFLTGSGTNNSTVDFNNATTGNLADIYANNSKQLIFRTNGATTALTLGADQAAAFTGQVRTSGQFRISADYAIQYWYKANNSTMLGYLLMRDNAANYLSTAGGQDFAIVDTTTNTRWITFQTSTKNVGIGTSAPVQKFHVLGDAIKFERTNNAVALQLYNNNASPADDAPLGYLQFMGKDNDGTASIVHSEVRGGVQSNTNSAVSGYLSFLTTNNGTSVTEAMRIKADGKVGIGTTAPSSLLTLRSSVAGAEDTFSIKADDGGNLFRVGKESNDHAYVEMFDGSGNMDVRFSTYGASYFVGGSVGIGTTSPSQVFEVYDGTSHMMYNGNINMYKDDCGLYVRDLSGTVGIQLLEGTSNSFIREGNFGIGNAATSPSTKLTVQDSGGTALAKIYQTAGTVSAGHDILEVRCDDTSDAGAYNLITANRSGTDIFVVQGDGKVGIGTTNPQYALEVAVDGGEFDLTDSGDSYNKRVRLGDSSGSGGFITVYNDAEDGNVVLRSYGVSHFTGGAVGIGTTSPSNSKLDVSGGHVNISNGSGIVWGGGSNRPYIIGNKSNGTLEFGEGGTEHFRMDTNGRIGIGTTAPDSLLEIENSSVAGNTQLHIHNNKTGDAAVLKLQGKRTSLNDTAQLLFANNGSNVALISAFSAADDGELRFSTSPTSSGDTLSERMRITSDGTVGIDVVPSNWGSSSDFRGLQIGTGGVVYGRGSGDGAKVGLLANAFRDNVADRFEYITTSYASAYEQTDGYHQFRTAASGTANNAITWSTSMTIDRSNRVGIGTTSPSAKLDVRGVRSSDYFNAIRLGNTDTGSGANQNRVGIEFWDRTTALNTAIIGSRGSIGGHWGGMLKFRVNQVNSPQTAESSLTDMLVFDGYNNYSYFPTGKVGIGTTAPATPLDVRGAGQDILSIRTTTSLYSSYLSFVNTAGTAYVGITNNTGGTIITGGTAYALCIRPPSGKVVQFGKGDGSAPTVTIDNGGKVGIGTTDPSRTLSVYRSSAGSVANFLHYTDASNFGGLYIDVSQATDIVTLNNSGSHGGVATDLQVSGTSIMYLKANGYVGIGTNAPSAILHVYKSTNAFLNGLTLENPNTGSSAMTGLYLNCGGKTLDLRVKNALSGNTGYINSSGTLYTGLLHDGGICLVAKSGKVGIGTTAPGEKLDVNGKIQIKGGNWLIFRNSDNSNYGSMRGASDTSNDVTINTNGEVIRFKQNGNVGIGTTAPSFKLEVVDSTTATGATYGYNGASINLKQSSDTDTNTAGYIFEGAVSAAYMGGMYMEFKDHSAFKSKLHWATRNASSFASKMTMDEDGKVGIGTTAPVAELHVASSNGVKVTKFGDDVTSHYKLSGFADHTLTLTCSSYYQAEVIITAHQTNGGDYNNLYMRGIWSNNHTSHHWDEIESVGSLTNSTFTITIGQNGSTTNSGELKIVHDYVSGSFTSMTVRVVEHGNAGSAAHAYNIS